MDERDISYALCGFWEVSCANIWKSVYVSVDLCQEELFGDRACFYWVWKHGQGWRRFGVGLHCWGMLVIVSDVKFVY